MKRTITRTQSITSQIVSHANEELKQEVDNRLYVHTGSTWFDLALSDDPAGGFAMGKVANIIGDSHSGKTFLSLSVLAEAANSEKFKDYELIYDDVESASEFNIEKLFGMKAKERIMFPGGVIEDIQICSRTIQDFHCNIHYRLEDNKPFIYVLDSFDALTDDDELARTDKAMDARKKGKEVSGTYGMNKAKYASSLLRLIANGVKRTNSLVIIISQTRDNIDPMSFTKKTRAGGQALHFYSSYEMWTAVEGKIQVDVNDKKRAIGMHCRAKISKNKVTGKERVFSVPIYYSYGIDNLGSCIDFLLTEGHWVKNKSGIIVVPEFKLELTKTKLIKLVEEKGWEDRIVRLVGKVWNEIEKSLVLDRKPRYI